MSICNNMITILLGNLRDQIEIQYVPSHSKNEILNCSESSTPVYVEHWYSLDLYSKIKNSEMCNIEY